MTQDEEILEAGTRAANSRPQATTHTAIPAVAHMMYLALVGAVVAIIALVFAFFPRSEYSELEKRDLASFPNAADYQGRENEYPAAISQWYSDSEPFRDMIMSANMTLRGAMRMQFGSDEEVVSIKAPVAETAANEPVEETIEAAETSEAENPLAEENAKIANAGIIIVGKGENVRALMAFRASPARAQAYVDLINHLAETFPNARVYAMPAPLATEFYLPEKAQKNSGPQRPVLNYVRDHLASGARFVDVYAALAPHVAEDIYLRTDHHWAPLGAHYAAKELARVAGVPFPDLSAYDQKVVHKFVGSMFGYSGDIAVKNAPEDFVYYTPKGLEYTTTYITYHLNKKYEVASASKPYTGQFFHHYKDGSGGAYSTFMGGDQHLVKVTTSTPGSRRLLIIKDSYGNAIPSNLFFSFAEVHVVDFRYFKLNLKNYIENNKITDIVVAFNVFNTVSSAAAAKVRKYLTQPDNAAFAPAVVKEEKPAVTDSVVATPLPEPEAAPASEQTQDPEPEVSEPDQNVVEPDADAEG